jgi:hypothetical protein
MNNILKRAFKVTQHYINTQDDQPYSAINEFYFILIYDSDKYGFSWRWMNLTSGTILEQKFKKKEEAVDWLKEIKTYEVEEVYSLNIGDRGSTLPYFQDAYKSIFGKLIDKNNAGKKDIENEYLKAFCDATNIHGDEVGKLLIRGYLNTENVEMLKDALQDIKDAKVNVYNSFNRLFSKLRNKTISADENKVMDILPGLEQTLGYLEDIIEDL